MRTCEENGVAKGAIVLQWAVRTASWDFKQAMGWCTAQWKMLLFVQKMLLFCANLFSLCVYYGERSM